jgi:hypothetical protein
MLIAPASMDATGGDSTTCIESPAIEIEFPGKARVRIPDSIFAEFGGGGRDDDATGAAMTPVVGAAFKARPSGIQKER